MTKTISLQKKRRLINWLGIAVLIFGLVCAGGVYLTGGTWSARHSNGQPAIDRASRDDTLSFEDSKTSARSTETYLGKVGVLMSTWFHRWEGLGDLQRLVIMIAMSSVLAASICFLVAHRLSIS
jgi:hypothetical protein